MLKVGAVVVLVPAMILCAALGRLAAAEPASEYQIREGTKPISVKIDKDQELPEGAGPLMAVDIVGEISEPIKTAIAILNVRLVALD